MDVVVHQAVAVLQVLAFGDAVRREDDVDLAERPLALRQLLGDGREPREDVLEGGPGELQRVGPVGAARNLGALDAELALQPGSQLFEKVRRRVGERAEHQHLAVDGVVRVVDLLDDKVAQLHELGIALGRHRVGVGQQGAEHLDVEVEVLAQAQGVDVPQVDAHLAAGLELLGIVVVEPVLEALGAVGDPRRVGVEPRAQVNAAVEDAAQRDAEAVNGGLHALEDVDAHEVRHRRRAVDLALEVLAPRVPVAVLVLAALVGAHVGEHLVLGERELGDRRQFAFQVDGRLERQGRPARRECPARSAVVLRDVLAAARDGQHVEQLEVVGVHRVNEALGRALGVGELAPLVEPLLGDARHVGDRRDAVGVDEVRVVTLGDELDLVSQVEQAVVHRGGREHEHLGALARLDYVLDEARVAVGLVRVGALVPEVVALVDDEEVEVAPPQVLEVHLAAHAVVARQVGVVEHRVAEAVVSQRVAIVVVLRPQGPVVPQALRTEHEDAVVALLVVLHDGERLVGLAQAHRVGDDAALVLLQLADGAHDGVLLEVVELVPDHGLFELEPGADAVVLVVLHEVAEQVVKGQEIDELGWVLAVERLDLGCHLRGDLLDHGGVVPDRLEHHLEADGLSGVLKVAHAGDGSRTALVAEAFLGEVRGGAHEGMVFVGGVLHHVGAARLDGAGRLGGLEDAPLADPLGAFSGERALVEVVAQRELEPRAADADLASAAGYLELTRLLRVGHALDEGGLAEQEAHLVDLGELLFELPVGEHGEIRADNRQLRAVVDGFAEGVSQALRADVV